MPHPIDLDAVALVRTRELLDAGQTQQSLRDAVNAGVLVRVRKGWYCSPTLSRDFQRAVRVGGRLDCVSAAVAYGLWVPPNDEALHVSVRANACQLRSPGDSGSRLAASEGVHIHWSDEAGGVRVIVPMSTMFEHLCECFEPEFVFIIVESALARGILRPAELHRMLPRLPLPHRRALATASDRSGSGTESRFVFRMRALGIQLVQQVSIGPDRVDVLIGEALVVELDSKEFHERVKDARRDARLSIRGKRVLRFPYELVFFEWSVVEHSVLAAISRGDHLST